MTKLSPQKEYLVHFLRDLKWHCGSEWASRVKDDRTRFCELEGYMAQRGYRIASEPCRGSVCGRRTCPLNKRRAEKIEATKPELARADILQENKRLVEWFDSYQPDTQEVHD